MDYYIGNTDYDWFNFLKNHNNPQQPEDINFGNQEEREILEQLNRVSHSC